MKATNKQNNIGTITKPGSHDWLPLHRMTNFYLFWPGVRGG